MRYDDENDEEVTLVREDGQHDDYDQAEVDRELKPGRISTKKERSFREGPEAEIGS